MVIVVDPIKYKKVKTNESNYLYLFKDINDAIKEEKYFYEIKDKDKLIKKRELRRVNLFGVTAFESDLDMSPELIYSYYKDRSLIKKI